MEDFNMQFSEGFVNDIYELMNRCADLGAMKATITLSDDKEYKVQAHIEFRITRKNAIEQEEKNEHT